MIVSLILIVVGLALLIVGAEYLIRGVSALAEAMGVPAIIIGLTVVAFGTSTPEVAVNVISATQGKTELAFGNIVGSCAINVGFVLALTAMLRPLAVQRSVISREMPMMLLAAAAFVILSLDRVLSGAPADVLLRSDGLMLLLIFGVFVYGVVVQTFDARVQNEFAAQGREQAQMPPARRRGWVMALMIVAGLAGVGGGGRMAVIGAVDVARQFHVSEAVIGLTLISFGTTLPELTTCILAARRGQSDIAIGNIVGSNIFNLLFIGGTVATIHPIDLPPGGMIDLLVMLLLCVLLLPLSLRGRRRLSRADGITLMTIYLAYLGYRTLYAS